MLPSDLFGKSSSPSFIETHDLEAMLQSNFTALTPHKRTTSDNISNVPSAKRLQLIGKPDNDSMFGMRLMDEYHPFETLPNIYDEALYNRYFSFPPESMDVAEDVSPAFITSRMKSFKVSDDQWPTFYQTSEQIPHSTAELALNITGNKTHHIHPLHAYSSDEGSDKHLLSGAQFSGSTLTRQSMPSMRPYIPSYKSESVDRSSDADDTVFDDGAGLLNNLPTSVDDLHEMEEQLKLERQMTTSWNSQRHTPSVYDASRLSTASAISLLDNSVQHPNCDVEDGFLDPDDMEVAMINESFEEQQRQYSMYYSSDQLKTAFYAGDDLPPTSHTLIPTEPLVPVTVPEVDEPSYNNQFIYDSWKTNMSPLGASYEAITQPIMDDLFTNVIPTLDDKTAQKSPANKRSSTGSTDSFDFVNGSLLKDRGPSFSMSFQEGIDDIDAIVTAVSSAYFVLDSVDSPCYKLDVDETLVQEQSPSLSNSPSNNSSEDEELIQAWNEIEQNGKAVIGGERYYLPRQRDFQPQPQLSFDMIEEPPKNIKTLNHVAEVYDPNGELDSEPILKFFRSRGMKNFYQRDIDIQRAFLVFPSVEQAKLAVDLNRTNFQLRLLEESPQFVKAKALKMHMELRPCCFEDDGEVETNTTNVPMPLELPWLSQPIAGV